MDSGSYYGEINLKSDPAKQHCHLSLAFYDNYKGVVASIVVSTKILHAQGKSQHGVLCWMLISYM